MRVTISGPGIDAKADAPMLGLSLAINHANRAAMRREETTYYVRDAEGNTVGVAQSDSNGGVTITKGVPA